VLRNGQGMLGLLLHAPRGPFYSPKAARSRWRQSWKAKVVFCRVTHRTVRCTTGQPLFMSGAQFPSKSGAADRCRLVVVGAPDTVQCPPDTVRCPLSTIGASHASPADLAADRCAGGRWLTGQSGAPPDSPVNYSRTPPKFSREWPVRWSWPVAPDTVRCTTGQSGAPRPSSSWLYTTNSFPILFPLFLSLRYNTLVPKSMY
jgi:hypothetical protein